MVGDAGYSDMCAGAAAGCRTVLVRTGWGASSLNEYRHEWADIEPDWVVDNLLEAAIWITQVTPAQAGIKINHTPIFQL